MHKKLSVLILILLITYCVNAQTEKLQEVVKNISTVIIHDIFTAPAASRIYAYSTIAGYETMHFSDSIYPSLFGIIKEFPIISDAEEKEDIDYTFAGLMAMYYTAKAFVFSEAEVQKMIDSLRVNYKSILTEKVLNDSERFGKSVAEKILLWSSGDGYKESKVLPRYNPGETESSWQATPPDYSEALEPYWGTLRTFVLDSAALFNSVKTPVFSRDTTSFFYGAAFQVYETGINLTESQMQISRFWDDNPFSTRYVGHLQYAEKKISPAGHWLNIAGAAITKTNTGIVLAAQIYAMVSIANADAFICCWKQKYSTNVMRPETYINKYIDPLWRPYLQTPPFPEYTSGHSTISAASATILTYYFGDHFVFSDESETEYDLPARNFNSFHHAAEEAGISRFYSGIHYLQSITEGSLQGVKIGNFLLQKLTGH